MIDLFVDQSLVHKYLCGEELGRSERYWHWSAAAFPGARGSIAVLPGVLRYFDSGYSVICIFL